MMSMSMITFPPSSSQLDLFSQAEVCDDDELSGDGGEDEALGFAGRSAAERAEPGLAARRQHERG
jgi:hypothetical protein